MDICRQGRVWSTRRYVSEYPLHAVQITTLNFDTVHQRPSYKYVHAQRGFENNQILPEHMDQ